MTAALIIAAAGWYLWASAAVALLFLTIGIDRIDEDARGAYAFRPLLIPGILMIWPLVLYLWLRAEMGWTRWQWRYSPPRSAHTVAASALFFVVGVTLLTAFSIRQTWPADFEPQRLSDVETAQ